MKQGISTLEQWQVEKELGRLIGELHAVRERASRLEETAKRERDYEREVLAEVQAYRQHLAALYSACEAPSGSGAR